MIRKQNENKFFFKNKKYRIIGIIKNPHKNSTISFFPFYSIEKSLSFLFVDIDNCFVPFGIKRMQKKNDREFLISFYRTDNFLIDILKNKKVYVEQNDFSKVSFPEEDFLDLIDYKVINEEGVLLGNVIEVSGNDLQKVIKVEKENGRSIYIPIVYAFINKINDKKKEIILNNYSKILL